MDTSDGLIFAYIMDSDGGANAIDWEGISEWRSEKGLLWIPLDCSKGHVKQWLQTKSKLNTLSCDILMEQDTRPRFITTQEQLNNRLSEQMNKAMYTLSIVAAIFLPLSLLTGLLGGFNNVY